ncbi:MAG: AMP nucleosidase [Alphaproteobacteria bacterium]|nr:AMP nucleosidase [Alphaproteobacteria bacterium]
MTIDFPITKAKEFTDAAAAVSYIGELYHQSSDRIKKAFQGIMDGSVDQSVPIEATYPFAGIKVEQKNLCKDPRLSFGVVFEPGLYGSTLTQPDIFGSYYHEQLSLLLERHKSPIVIGASQCSIPLPFVVDHTPTQLDEEQLWNALQGFVLPNLSRIDDNIPNGTAKPNPNGIKPLALFAAERVDFSLHRLQHYTATQINHFQSFVLLTNYQRYIDEFIVYGKKQIKANSGYTELIGPGNSVLASNEDRHEAKIKTPKYLPQMPAYHLKRADGQGITFINIGVGPSNAKTITDHLAVLRPHCWLMLGHCAGLRGTQVLGDYVLAHAYVREDHVLDQDLPPWIPLPPIAEVQVALQKAVINISGEEIKGLKSHMRTGTVLTTDNRNWELRSHELYERFIQSRAIAVDMESATVAANGFRFRVPYGTLLCVSDKPIHGEIKLQGMANAFYRQRVSQHLEIGLEAVRLLREGGVDQLHSRKLRGFDEPPFR